MLEVSVTLTVTVLTSALLLPDVLELLGLRQRSGAEGMVGARGRVLEALNPTGWVQVHGERWAARSEEASCLEPKQEVEVVALEGLTAIVRKASGPPEKADIRPWPVRHPIRATAVGVLVAGGTIILVVHASALSALLPAAGALLSFAWAQLDA